MIYSDFFSFLQIAINVSNSNQKQKNLYPLWIEVATLMLQHTNICVPYNDRNCRQRLLLKVSGCPLEPTSSYFVYWIPTYISSLKNAIKLLFSIIGLSFIYIILSNLIQLSRSFLLYSGKADYNILFKLKTNQIILKLPFAFPTDSF